MTTVLLATLLAMPSRADVAIPPMRVEPAVALLSEQIGMRLQVDPSVPEAVVCIYAKDADETELLERMAVLAAGKWLDRDGVPTLVVDQAKLDEELDLERDRLVAEFEERKKNVPADRLERNIEFSLLEDLNLRPFLPLEEAERVVLSPRPNALQHRLVSPNFARVERALIERDLADMEHVAPSVNQPEVPQSFRKLAEEYGLPWERPQSEHGPPVKMVIVLGETSYSPPERGSFLLSAVTVDELGRIVGSYGLDGNSFASPPPPPRNLADELGIERPDLHAIQLQPDTLALQRFFTQGAGNISAQIGDAARPLMAKTLERDPLYYGFAELAKALHDELGFSISWRLSDSLAGYEPSPYGVFAPRPGQVSAPAARDAFGLLERLLTTDLLNLERDGSWLEIRPERPHSARRYHAPRAAMQKLGSQSRQGNVPFHALLEYAKDAPGWRENGLVFRWLLTTAGSSRSYFEQPGHTWEGLRFYARLNPNQRRPGDLPIASLSPYQRESMRKLVFGQLARMEMLEQFPFRQNEDQLYEFSNYYAYGTHNLQIEPSEAILPDFVQNGVLRIAEQPMLVVADTNSARTVLPTDLRRIAYYSALRRRLPPRYDISAVPEYESVWLGTGKDIDYAFALPSKLGYLAASSVVNERNIETNGKPVSIDNLPDPYASELARNMRLFSSSLYDAVIDYLEWQISAQERMYGGGEGTIPPD